MTFAVRRSVFAALLLIGAPTAWSQSTAIANGTAWLRGQVQTDGSLASEAGSIALPTQSRSETALTLAVVDTLPSSLPIAVESATGAVTEYFARRALVMAAAHGDPSPRVADILGLQNADGGFGTSADYASSQLDTAFALMGLSTSSAVDSGKVSAALAYLRGSKHADGGWGVDDQSSIYVTACVMLGVQTWATQLSATDLVGSAHDWLFAQRSTSQAYPRSFDNAIALLALASQSGQSVTLQPIADALVAAQQADGSWSDDPYVTALALRALHLSSQPGPNQITARGRVIDGQTAQALSGASISLVGPQSYGLSTDSNGSFVFSNVAAGAYTLTVAATGFNSVTATTVATAGQALDFGTIALLSSASGASTTGTVKGVVTDATTHQPISGTTVTANGISVATATDGSYEVPNVAAGSVSISASASGYQTVTGTGSLPAGGIVLFSPQLSTGSASGNSSATLVGTITDANTHQPIAGATITIIGAATATATTDAAGTYQTGGVSAGTSQIVVTASGYDRVAVATQFQLNTTVTFSPTLYPTGTSPVGANTAGIGGLVVDSTTQAALSNVNIAVTSPDGTRQTVVTGADGRFVAIGLAQDQVVLSFSRSGYVAAQFSVRVLPLSTFDIGQVRLRPESANVLLPDLTVAKVDSNTSASTDPQTFQLSGNIQVLINNIGTASTGANFNVLAFYDVNHNGVFDSAIDIPLGNARVTQSIAVGQSVSIPIAVSGQLSFRDAPISVVADSGKQIIEITKANNVGTSASQCEIAPHQGSAFTPVLKWAWSGSTTMPQYNQVMMAPAVARTHDDNGDGKIDQNDTPDVIFVAYGGNGYDLGDGILRIISGKDGSDLVAVIDPRYRLTSYGNLAVGDINGDGNVEIIGPKFGGGLIAFAHDGMPLWTVSFPVNSNWDFGAPAIVDLNGDGHPVIIFGGHVVSATGQLLWSASNGYIGGSHPNGSGGIAVDLNNDGHMAVLLGASAFSASGQLLWQNSTVGDGIDAVGQFNSSDPYPEIVVVGNGRVSLLDHQGHLIWGPAALPGGGRGGAPIVADLDGDGIPEIGVAGYSNYAVFNPDGSVRWTSVTHDYSSACTSSTVFDFYNDGRKEILYSDEQYLRAYNGNDGQILWRIQNSTGTAYELPVLADIDGSGEASLLVVSNYYYGQYPGATTGIRAFTDQNNAWADTRQIWNQLSYHINNVNDDGSIPQHESASWLSHNTYRLNATVNPFGRADLTAGLLEVIDNGTGQAVTLRARIGNGGQIASGPTTVAFYSGDPGNGGKLVDSVPISAVDSAQYQDVQLTGVTGLNGTQDVYVVADPANLVQECDKSNNVDHVPYAPSNMLAQLRVATDAASYGPGNPAQLTAVATNSSSFAENLSISLRIEDAVGNVVVDFGNTPLGVVNAGAVVNQAKTWNTANTLAGPYVLHGLLYAASGTLLTEAHSAFSIAAGSSSMTSAIHTDKRTYNPTDHVIISSRVTSTSSNAILSNLTVTIRVVAPDQSTVYTTSYSITQLLPGNFKDFSATDGLVQAAPGTYTAIQTVTDSTGAVLDTQQAQFDVTSTTATGTGLTGTLAADPHQVSSGQSVGLNGTVSNQGNADLSALPVKLSVIDPAHQQVLWSWPTQIDLARNATAPVVQAWVTTSVPVGNYIAVLTATVGGKDIVLAQDNIAVTVHLDATVTVTAGTPPLAGLALVDPTASSAQTARVSAALSALGYQISFVSTPTDFASGVRTGAYSLYLLLASQVAPDAETARLLREAVHRGEGLVVASGVAAMPEAVAATTGLMTSNALPVINASALDALATASGGAAHVALNPSLASRIVVAQGAQEQATLTGRLPVTPDLGFLSDELARMGRADVGYFGTDAGVNGTGLALTSMGRFQAADGSDQATVWRIRNSGDLLRNAVLSSVSGGYSANLTISAHTDTFVTSPIVAGTANHQLLEGAQLIQMLPAMTTVFSDQRMVDVGDNPGVIALWANAINTADALDWSGAQHQLYGAVHSNSDMRITGAQNLIDGPVHYVTDFSSSGSQNTFTVQPRAVAVQPLPTLLNLDEFRPGGSVASAVGVQYYDGSAECASSGRWQRNPSQMPLASGVYWIPCDVKINGANAGGTVTLVTTGTIEIAGAKATFQPYYQGLQFGSEQVGGTAMHLSGSQAHVGGLVFAPQATVEATGSSMVFQCGIVADQIRLAGAKTTIDPRNCAYATVQRRAPGVLLNDYGSGRSAYAAFDWQSAIGQYETGTPGEFSQLFLGVLAHVAPNALTLRAGSVVPVSMGVQSNADPFQGQLTLAANDDSAFVTPGVPTWLLDFSKQATFLAKANVRLGSGTSSVLTATVSASTPIAINPLKQASVTVTHIAGENISVVVSAVSAIANPDAGLAATLTALQSAQASAASGDKEGSLQYLLSAAEACAQSTNTLAEALRTRIDWVIWRAAQ